MKIRNADELINFLKFHNMLSMYDTIYLNKYLYELLIEKDWDCPLGSDLKKAKVNGLKIIKD